MQALKDDIRARILATARQQFTKKGYLKTSMREVANASGIGVGNIYHYFLNKDEMFQAVVHPVISSFNRMLIKHHGHRGTDVMEMLTEAYFHDALSEYLSLFKAHRELMKLLLFKAQGSSLESFKEGFTDRSTEMVKEWFENMKNKYPQINVSVSDFMIHLHSVWMFTLFEEILMHRAQGEEIERIVTEYIQFEIQGWKSIIGI